MNVSPLSPLPSAAFPFQALQLLRVPLEHAAEIPARSSPALHHPSPVTALPVSPSVHLSADTIRPSCPFFPPRMPGLPRFVAWKAGWWRMERVRVAGCCPCALLSPAREAGWKPRGSALQYLVVSKCCIHVENYDWSALRCVGRDVHTGLPAAFILTLLLHLPVLPLLSISLEELLHNRATILHCLCGLPSAALQPSQ